MIQEFLIRWAAIVFAGFMLGLVFLGITSGSLEDLGPFMIGIAAAGFVVTTIWMIGGRK